MTRQRLAQWPNRSRSRTWILVIRFCQVSTPAHSSLQRFGNRAARALRPGGDRLVAREAAAGAGIVKAPQQGLQHLQEGAGDRALVLLAGLAVSGAPGAGVGGNAGLGVAVQ